MHLLEELVTEGRLRCPDGRGRMVVHGGRIVSTETGRDFGGVGGPLNLFSEYLETIQPGEVPRQEIARVREHLELPADQDVDATIAQALAATGIRCSEAHLSTEAHLLFERFRCGAPDPRESSKTWLSAIRGALAAAGESLPWGPKSETRVVHVRNSIGERLTAGMDVWRGLRVRNEGKATLASTGLRSAAIQVRWTTPDGKPLPRCTLATGLPVDLAPEREISLNVRMRAPVAPGSYVVHVVVMVPGSAEATILTAPVEAIACELPVFEYAYSAQALEYSSDHHVAMLDLVEFLQEGYPGRFTSILEIGGGVHPTGHAIAALGHRVVSCDISHAQSLLGTLYFSIKRPDLDARMAFVSCEGTDLPFEAEAFDGVMLISSFHHFADPIALLEEAKRVTRPGGFIYLGCECCVPEPADPRYREELRSGINEQMWTLAEFTEFFRRARVRVVRARIDHSSLKVALVK